MEKKDKYLSMSQRAYLEGLSYKKAKEHREFMREAYREALKLKFTKVDQKRINRAKSAEETFMLESQKKLTTKNAQKIGKDDFLKFFRITKLWFCEVYNLEEIDIEYLFLIYNEAFFSEEEHKKMIGGFGPEAFSIRNCLGKGLIIKSKHKKSGVEIYSITPDLKRAILMLIDKLNGKIDPDTNKVIPMSAASNPFYNWRTTKTGKLFLKRLYFGCKFANEYFLAKLIENKRNRPLLD
jgi:hypothetical protein